MVSSSGGTRVVQVTNIAPQATKDQMQTLFGFLGKIDDIRLYPTVRDVSCPVASRICYLRYYDSQPAHIAQHMTNTVFIDRALIVVPVANGEIPDEHRALEMSSNGTLVPGLNAPEPRLPSHVVNTLEGLPPNQVVQTHDPRLAAAALPPYPPLPASYDSRKIEEIRRTILIIDVPEGVSSERLIELMAGAGEVKYLRFCTRDADRLKYVLVEFSEQDSVLKALQMHGSTLEGRIIQVHHATQAITKPQTKSNEAAQREIEEAMCRVKEAQNLISAAIDPVIGLLSKDKRRTRSRSRSRRRSRSKSRSRRSRSRHRSRRSRSRHRARRSRSRHRRSRTRSSHRSSRSKRSRSRSRHRSSRSKRDSSKRDSSKRDSSKRDSSKRDSSKRDSSKDRDKDKKESRRKEKSKTPAIEAVKGKSPPKGDAKEIAVKDVIAPPLDVEKRSPLKDVKRSRSRDKKRSRSKEKRRSRSRSRRSRSRDRKRTRSRDRKRSRSRDRKRSRSRERKRTRSRDRKRSRSRDRKRTRSRDKKRSKSRDRKRSRSRDTSRTKRKSKTPMLPDRKSREKTPAVPVAEKGLSPPPPLPRTYNNDEKNSPDNMDISNSP